MKWLASAINRQNPLMSNGASGCVATQSRPISVLGQKMSDKLASKNPGLDVTTSASEPSLSAAEAENSRPTNAADNERNQFEAMWNSEQGVDRIIDPGTLFDRREVKGLDGASDTDPNAGLYLTHEELSDLHTAREFIQLLRSKNLDVSKIRAAVAYEYELESLQIELVKLQRWVQEHRQRVAILVEGRDAAGKGGTIRRFIEHLNPRAMRVVALPTPSEEERGQWYFQRYMKQLPTGARSYSSIGVGTTGPSWSPSIIFARANSTTALCNRFQNSSTCWSRTASFW